MTPRQKRMWTIGLVGLGLSIAVALALTAFRENILFFYSPTEIVSGNAPEGSLVRVGGLVEEGSVKREPNSLKLRFDLTDLSQKVTVNYEGILPDLFREGQGIVAQGRLRADRTFEAVEVLAKHDEKYMPPQVAGALAATAKERFKR